MTPISKLLMLRTVQRQAHLMSTGNQITLHAAAVILDYADDS